MFGKRLLVWDSYRCHISTDTKKVLKQLRLDTAVIPGGCTKFLQAPDVYWNAMFKSFIRKEYEDWMVHGTKSFTPAGNMRAPSMEVYLKWIQLAWENIPKEYIVRSFKGCGLKNGRNGEDDEAIHCFKKDGEIPEGVQLLKTRRAEREMEAIQEILGDIEIEEDDGEMNHAEEEDNNYDSDAPIF